MYMHHGPEGSEHDMEPCVKAPAIDRKGYLSLKSQYYLKLHARKTFLHNEESPFNQGYSKIGAS